MKYALIAYAILMALVLTLKPEPAGKGPQCGPGVLCIRDQKTVQAELQQAAQRYTEKATSQVKSR